MARGIELLTAAQVRSLKEPGHYRDGGGLYLQVSKWGTKSWIFKFTVPLYETLTVEEIAAGRTPRRIRGKLRSMGLGSVFDYNSKIVKDDLDANTVASMIDILAKPSDLSADEVLRLRRVLSDVLAKPRDLRLDEARKLRRILASMVEAGIDPIEHRTTLELRKQAAVRAEAEASRLAEEARRAEEVRRKTFAVAVEEYLEKKDAEPSNDRYRQAWRNSLYAYALPVIGDMNVADITMQDMLRVLNQEFRDKSGQVIGTFWEVRTETASRLRQRIEEVLTRATVAGYRRGDNPARWEGNLKPMLAAPSKIATKTNQPALELADLPEWFSELRKRTGMGARALEFAVLCASRSGEVRGMTWDEVRDLDGEKPVWIIPAARMKMDREHKVPLSSEAVKLLRTLPRISGVDLVFPAVRGGQLSDMTISKVMKVMHQAKLKEDGRGYIDAKSKRPAVLHGTCRATFRTWVQEETQYDSSMAEIALAHKIDSKVAQAYARGDMLKKRLGMMEHWASICLGKIFSGSVVDFPAKIVG